MCACALCLLSCLQTAIDGVPLRDQSQCLTGVTFTCTDADIGCTPGDTATRWWSPPLLNFDNIGRAMLTLFVVTTMDNWMSITRSVMDVRGEGQVPEVRA